MRRTVGVLSLILALLFLAVASVHVNLATATSVLYYYFPTEPDTSPPTITVQSPIQNQILYSTNVWLNFTIIKPETWFKSTDMGVDEEGNPLYVICGNITSVYYVVDGGERQNIPMHDITYFAEAFPKRTLNFSANLMLPEGSHSITVSAEGESYYMPTGYWSYGHSTIAVHGTSETINFTVAKPPEPEPEPSLTILVVGVSVAAGVVIASIGFVYYNKNKKKISSL